jgi:uncharacterized protein (DUF302 family)
MSAVKVNNEKEKETHVRRSEKRMMPSSNAIEYGYVRTIGLPFEEAVKRTEAALKAEGFGVLSQIDIQAKLKEKLGIDFPRYTILGACNPALAHQALENEINLGLLLPCSAVVYERDDQIHVGVVDAVTMLSVVGNPEVEKLARQVTQSLRRVVDSVAEYS